jgi:DNA-binding transcriptional MerR regulator
VAIEGETAAGKRRRLAASRQGAQTVRSEFAAALTRKRYCELVGIHASTLARWERLGVVQPEMAEVLGIPTRIFSPEQVEFGKRLRVLLHERHGTISVKDAAALVRAD